VLEFLPEILSTMDPESEKLLREYLAAHPVTDKDREQPADIPGRTEELDLHGMTVAAAEAALTRMLRECRERGCAILRVVTGKGIHPRTGGRCCARR
jgi:DNA-nicking Smr family endonuclease